MKITNPAFDYDKQDHDYSNIRKADPRIGKYVLEALADCNTILNVGAGAGSYEPEDKYVIAVEPSSVMRKKRLENGKTPALNAKADDLPFDDKSFDASLAILTIHHWQDIAKGLNELRRVTRKKIAILTYDPDELDVFWNINYFPEVVEVERSRYPKIEFIRNCVDTDTKIVKIPIPFDCSDGFQEAFYGRPEAFLQKEVRKAQSAWGYVDEATEERIVGKLAEDLETGKWDELYGEHRKMPFFTGAFRLIELNLF